MDNVMSIISILAILIGSLVGFIMIYLVVIIFLPFMTTKPVEIDSNNKLEELEPSEFRQAIEFDVDGEMVRGWLYLPEDTTKSVGCVIMSNGFGGTIGMVMEQYALRFREAGYATLCYDFRNFGLSDGTLRQHYNINKQLEDLAGAIEFARGIETIHPDKIAVWGTSGSGGYGLIHSARYGDIACVIGQCPALDKEADSKMMLKRDGILKILSLLAHAQRDKGRARFGLSPHKVPIAGGTNDFAFFSDDDALSGYGKLISPTFVNEICARMMLAKGGLNAMDFVTDVDCPVLILSCEKDNLVTASSHEDAAKRLGNLATLIQYPWGHFDIYIGEAFEKTIVDQIEFLDKHM